MLFVLVIFKSVLHVVCVRYGVVMYHGVGEEQLLRIEKEDRGGGGGGGCCLRADLCMGRLSQGLLTNCWKFPFNANALNIYLPIFFLSTDGNRKILST